MKIELDDQLVFEFEKGGKNAGAVSLTQMGEAFHNPEAANFDGVIEGGLTVLLSLMAGGLEIPQEALREALEQLVDTAAYKTVDEDDE